MRTCTRCGQEKPEAHFNFRLRALGVRFNHCRECTRRAVRLHYEADPAPYKQRAKAWTSRQRAENRQRLWDYLKAHPCIDCGETDPVVLELDHVDGTVKAGNICTMVNRPCSWDAIASEIGKCEVRCANCHRRRTARQMGWWLAR